MFYLKLFVSKPSKAVRTPNVANPIVLYRWVRKISFLENLYVDEIPRGFAAAGEDARLRILCIVFARSRAYENDLGRRYRPPFQLRAMAALRA